MKKGDIRPCGRCGREKTFQSSWNPQRWSCIPCQADRARLSLGGTPVPKSANCKHCGKPKALVEYARRKTWECKPCIAISATMKRYGVSRSLAIELRAIDACQVCGGTSIDGRSLHVDHCHDTNKIRGVLCSECNKTLGLVKDDATRLQKLAEYLMEMS